MPFRPLTTGILLLASCSCCLSQSQGFKQDLTMSPTVKPAFHVTPMSHKLMAARGKVFPIEFQVESVDRATTINVRSVALRQQLDGTILPDSEALAPDNLIVVTPEQIKLSDNDKYTIKCRVRVPTTNSNFHSFGLLMRDLGRIVDRKEIRASDNQQRRVGIRFVTQYLLRVDITVKNARGEDASQLEVETVNLTEDRGFAKAAVIVHNPTTGPLEFQARARLLRGGQQAGKNTFNLVMPNRARMDSAERFNIRILPGARVRLEEMLPEAVFPGNHQMELSFLTNRRTRKKDLYPLAIAAGDFPAQDASIVQAARDITISPTQLELSRRRGGKRRAALEIKNHSQQQVQIALSPPAGESFPAGFVVRPQTATIRAGSKRKFLAMIDTRHSALTHEYTGIGITVSDAAGIEVGVFDVPVALVARSDESPDVNFKPIRWDNRSQPPAFVVPIRNTGTEHFPVNATLKVIDAFGRVVEMKAGYGRWLLPNQQTMLRFRTKFAPPAGNYRYHIAVDGTNSLDPIELTGSLSFGDDGVLKVGVTFPTQPVQLDVGGIPSAGRVDVE